MAAIAVKNPGHYRQRVTNGDETDFRAVLTRYGGCGLLLDTDSVLIPIMIGRGAGW